MVIVNLMGGIGNQLFQYAAGRSLALHHQVEFGYLFEDHYKLANRTARIHHFNIKGRFLQPYELPDYFPLRKVKRRVFKVLGLHHEGRIYREKEPYSFDRFFFNAPHKTFLYGSWQSYRYFEPFQGELRTDLVIKAPSEKFLNAMENIKTLQTPVSLHIRRGDYLNSKSGFSPVPFSYYQRAIDYLKEKLDGYTPVLFSDDPAWVKENFSFSKNPVFACKYDLEEFEELILMSVCNHHVIANSSFSWWGAWLNPDKHKIVIAPEHWHSMHNEKSDLIPDNWLKLS